VIILTEVLCISDIRTFMLMDEILSFTNPEYVILLGDILYDGPGQIYVLKKDELERIAKDLNDSRIVRLVDILNEEKRNVIFVYDGKYNTVQYTDYFLSNNVCISANTTNDSLIIIHGNSHSKNIVNTIHQYYFFKFLEKCVENDTDIIIVNGNHDKDIDYYQLISKVNTNIAKHIIYKKEHFVLDFSGLKALFLHYKSYLGKYDYDIIFTHATYNRLRAIVKSVNKLDRTCLIVSGHCGVGYYPPNEVANALLKEGTKIWEKEHKTLSLNKRAYLLRIDSSPFNFSTLNINNKRISGKLFKLGFKLDKPIHPINTVDFKISYC